MKQNMGFDFLMINLIIPAAGAATRLRPLSSNISKIMIRINGKPCLDYIIEQAKKLSNINSITIIDGKFDDIREYCKVNHKDVKFVKQYNLLGPRDAIKLGFNTLSEKDLDYPSVVGLGDTILLDKHINLGQDILVCKNVDNQENWCMGDGSCFYNKCPEKIDNAVALVGVYSFSDSRKAKHSFNVVNKYDISYSLEDYGLQFEKVMTKHWYDIGDLSSYHKTCASLLNMKSRAFNNLQYDSDLSILRKSPDYHDEQSMRTLFYEKNGYKDITIEQSLFTPRVFNIDNELVMSYESGILLSDFMLYENLSESFGDYIIEKVFNIKFKYFTNKVLDEEFINSFKQNCSLQGQIKLNTRFNDLDKTKTIYFSNKAKDKLNELCLKVQNATKPIQGMHGDLHFGNILYNQSTNQIKFLDPRGQYGEYISSNGDNLYDLCKLSHDLYHGYNALVANKTHNNAVKKVFIKKLNEYNLPTDLIIDGGLVLLASCIPLHYDDVKRQQRMIDYVNNELGE